uniref:Phospholipid scramblase n=1 Tax=Leptobrachium leishanense TaxID=445787 RepID=A0A8C5LU26_9ANUR
MTMAEIPMVPPGLEPLLQTDTVHVKETRHSTFQSCCTYDVLTSDGCLVYNAEEEQSCCGPRFSVWVRDLRGGDILHILLPTAWSSCESKMQVISVPGGSILGYIDRTWKSFVLLTPTGQPTLEVRNPGWGSGFMSDINYRITPYNDKTPLGVITRVWRGFRKEFLSSTDHYAIQFPADLDVKIKALLVACVMFIEKENRESQQNASAATASSASAAASGAAAASCT